jgi:hypothetical protein
MAEAVMGGLMKLRGERGALMHVSGGKKRRALAASLLSSVLVLGGCATTFKYAFDMKTSFAEQKSYAWAPSMSLNQGGHMLESNVQVLADPLLAQKGFKKTSEKADLEIVIGFVSESYGNKVSYQIQELNLSIYRAEKRELVWRGSALGSISTDAASEDLKRAVEGILSNFPPKGQ